MNPATLPLSVQRIHDEIVDTAGVVLSVARFDLIHPRAPGNKLFKLLPNLLWAREQGLDSVASFGGVYSNHIHALAALGQEHGVHTVGFIRDTSDGGLTPTLEDARRWGMALHFLSRSDYRRRRDPGFLGELEKAAGHACWIPEGGSNLRGVQGCLDMVECLRRVRGLDFDELVLPVGTGGTLAGIAAGLSPGQRVLGLAVLKGEAFLAGDVSRHLSALGVSGRASWQLDYRFDQGGYARTTPELLAFMRDWEARHRIPLEPVYSGKMMFGLYQRLRTGEYPRGARLIALHTGGLQGLRGGLSASDRDGV